MGSSEAELTLVLKARNLANREVDKLHGAMGRLKGSVRGVGGALATLAKVGILAMITGLVAAIGFLGMATKKAAEEQKGIVRLDAALRANVKSYKGNTDAIEAMIKKREELAFSDDSLRASLTTLVAKYKDSDKAIRLQATAMDLARLKGISLEDATVMLTKGLDGNAKILKQLGVTLPKTATEQERLTAIQKIAAGQAEAYGKTAAGAQEAFGIAIGDVVEDIGAGLLPIMTQAFTWLRVTGIPAVRGMIKAISDWLTANKPLVDQVRKFVADVLGKMVTVLGTVVTGVAKVVGILWGGGKGPLAIAVGLAGDAFRIFFAILEKVFAFIGKVIDKISTAIGALQRFIDKSGSVGGGISNLNDFFGSGAGSRVASGLDVPTSGARVASPGYQLVAVSEKDIARMVDERLYFTLRRAAPTSGRV